MKGLNPFDPSIGAVFKRMHDYYEAKLTYYRTKDLSPEEVAREEFKLGLKVAVENDDLWSVASMTAAFLDLKDADQQQLDVFTETGVDLAREGDRVAIDCCAHLLWLYSKHGLQIPLPLAELAADVMVGKLEVQKNKGRPKPQKRDIMIQETIIILLQCFPRLKPTRNEASDTQSACSIVTAVLADFGIRLSEKSVEAVFSKRSAS